MDNGERDGEGLNGREVGLRLQAARGWSLEEENPPSPFMREREAEKNLTLLGKGREGMNRKDIRTLVMLVLVCGWI